MPYNFLTLAFVALLAAVTAAADRPTGAADTAVAQVRVAHEPPPDHARLTLSPATGAAPIPFDLFANHIYLRGRVNDSDSLWVVLDSGAGGNVIDDEVSQRIGLQVASMGHGRGAGGEVAAGQVPSVSIKLPGVTLDSVGIQTMPLSPFRKQSGRGMDVIVGAPLIQRCVLRIDYAARTLEFLPSEGWQYRGQGAIVPLTFEYGHPYVTARIALPGRKPIDGRFVIDLGSSQAVILTPTFIDKKKVMADIGPTVEGRGRGVGGQLSSRIGRIPWIELGGVRFERPITSLPLSSQTFVGARDAIGNIGGDIMKRFTVTLDYARRRMILEPNDQLRDPFEADMMGFGLHMGPEGSHALEVEWIQPDSPAAKAGIQPNDLIEQVDGKPALEVGVVGMRALARKHGEHHVFSIKRGEQTLAVTLTTRRMI